MQTAGTIFDFVFFFFLMTRRPRKSPLFPYTTLFRSRRARDDIERAARRGAQSGRGEPITRSRLVEGPVTEGDHAAHRRDGGRAAERAAPRIVAQRDRHSPRLNSSHVYISNAVLDLKR